MSEHRIMAYSHDSALVACRRGSTKFEVPAQMPIICPHCGIQLRLKWSVDLEEHKVGSGEVWKLVG